MENFKLLNSKDYAKLKPVFEKAGIEHSYYCLASILMWNECLNSYYYKLQENTLLIMETEKEKKRLLMPIKSEKLTPQELKKVLIEENMDSFYYCWEDYFPHGFKEAEEYFEIIRQESQTDYIYLTEDLSRLEGRKYSKKRNLLSQFNKNFVDKNLCEVLILNGSNSADITQMTQLWAKAKENPMEIEECEFEAIEKSVKNWNAYELFGVSVYIDKKIAGFAIGSFLNSKMADLNFEKAKKDIKGLYQFLDNEFAKSVPANFTYINKESDLGIPGLAKSKDSYYPLKKPKSFILNLKK